jgi:septum site-determining protein MinD
VTRFAKKRANSGEMMSVENVQELLGIPLLGIIPESSSVLNASNSGEPVILDQKSDAGRAYQSIVSKFLGTPKAAPKKGFFKRLLRGKQEVTA